MVGDLGCEGESIYCELLVQSEVVFACVPCRNVRSGKSEVQCVVSVVTRRAKTGV